MFTKDQFTMAFLTLYAQAIEDDNHEDSIFRLYRLPNGTWSWMCPAAPRLNRLQNPVSLFYDALMKGLVEKRARRESVALKRNWVLAYRCAEALVKGMFPKEAMLAFANRVDDLDFSIPNRGMVELYRKVQKDRRSPDWIERRLEADHIDSDYQRISHHVFERYVLTQYTAAAHYIHHKDGSGGYDLWGSIARKAQGSPHARLYELRLVDSYLSSMIIKGRWEEVVRSLKSYGYRLSPDVLIAALTARFKFELPTIEISDATWTRGCTTESSCRFNNSSPVFGELIRAASVYYTKEAPK